jgi:diguanylate cyclase (GGDEF)-like protein
MLRVAAADAGKVTATRIPARVHAAVAVLAATLLAYVALLLAGRGSDGLGSGLYYAVMVGSCALCAARARMGGDPAVWLMLAVALALWTGGDVVWDLTDPSGISIADAGYLGFYVFASLALVLLLHRRASGTLATLWADGWAAALTVAAIAAYFFVEPVIAGSAGGDLASLLVNLAYPVADTLLLAFLVGAAVATRGRMRASWLALSAALVVMAVSDGVYLNLSWAGTYVEGTLLEAGWPAAALALGWAAWTTCADQARRSPLADRAPIVWPVLWGAAALTVVAVLGSVEDSHPIPIVLASAGVVSVFGRLMLTDGQNRSLARAASRQALTDPVTGLGNHRALTFDLEEALATTPQDERVLLAVFDLNGFKDYNDHFGHPAGDALLARLGGRLRDALAGTARTYRMGGDEFCVLAIVEAGAEQDFLLSRTGHLLSERGDGFTVSASGGHVIAQPGEMTASAALCTADERMYAVKRSTRASSLQQATAVLAAVAQERDPLLGAGETRTERLAERVAQDLGLEGEQVAHVRYAARLHDIGKLAIPDEILDKTGPLDDAELEFVRTHPLVGERIADAAPALAPVAQLIRLSHERYDGAGYPDGLAGADIPLGARIVFVCDAFEAMTSERAYRDAVSDFEALAELTYNAGTQFDPAVVRAFASVLAQETTVSDIAA